MQLVREKAEWYKAELRREFLQREFQKRKAQEFEEFCANYR